MCCRANKTTLGEDKNNHNNAKQEDTTTSTKTMTLSAIVALLHCFKSLKPKPQQRGIIKLSF